MAEVAIPLIALGGLYIFSNQKDKKEEYSNMGLKAKLPNIPKIVNISCA